MEEWQNSVWLTGVWRVYRGVEQGWNHNAVHSIRRTGRDGALESLMDGGKEWISGECEWNKSHVANGRMGKTFREVE